MLTSDGTVRWLGDAVGKLMAADNMLEPRVRLIADERLSGAPRESVQARIDLWLKAHITKLLGPLFELSKAEDVTGIARGIAFQLVEALGVMERQKVAAEMKDLDQPSRATLRKYGVRFGAYHIYLPGLLKPAARALALLLWSLKHDNTDLAALTTAQHLAGSGRTSFPADKALDRDGYRTLGYRLAGERAVRVDILERLADLIRPALAWREGSSLPKPPGTYDGRSFMVTQAMTSLTGSAGEDFASILKALGYRMDRRPPLPPEPVVAAEPVADAQPAEAASDADTVATTEAIVESALNADVATEAVAENESAPVAEQSAVSDVVASEAAPEPATVVDGEASSAAPEIAPEAPVAEAIADAAIDGDAPKPAEAAAAPELVEVWRPAGRHDDRRHHRHERGQRRDQAQASSEAGDGERGRKGHHRHDRNKKDFSRFRRPEAGGGQGAGAPAAEGVQAAEGAANARPPREDRRGFQGKGGKGRPDQGRRDQRHGHGQRQDRPVAQRPQRDRPIDPNSPFAKLAALKEQLESGAKEKL